MAEARKRPGGNPGYRFTNRVVVGHLRQSEYPNGDLIALCWCERRHVRVAPAEIRAGRTESCGHARCEPKVDA